MTNELNSILNADTRAAHAAKLEAQARAFTASLNVGDWIAWENGIGITEVEQVRLSKRLGELVVRGAFNNEIRIYTLARIPNNHRKYTAPAK